MLLVRTLPLPHLIPCQWTKLSAEPKRLTYPLVARKLCCSNGGLRSWAWMTFELIQIEKIMASGSRIVVDSEKDLSKNIFEKTFEVGSNNENLGSRSNYLSSGIHWQGDVVRLTSWLVHNGYYGEGNTTTSLRAVHRNSISPCWVYGGLRPTSTGYRRHHHWHDTGRSCTIADYY